MGAFGTGMASANLKENLTCSVCKSVYKVPVTLPCGHNFCKKCIEETWNHQDRGEAACPDCMRRYKNPPELTKNVSLNSLCQLVCQTLEQVPEETPEETGVPCSHCIDVPIVAIKSCMTCEVSLCAGHLRVHSNSARHILTKPTATFSNRKCSVHNMILEYYCLVDDLYICVYCRLGDGHTGHTIQSLCEASSKKKEKLAGVLEKMNLEMEKIDKTVEHLQERARTVQDKASEVTELMRDIRKKLEMLEKSLLGEMFQQEKTSVSDLIRQQEIKKHELSKKMRHVEELCHEGDPMAVLNDHAVDNYDVCDPEDQEEGPPAAQCLDEGPISQMLHEGLADVVIMAKRRFNVQETLEILLDLNTAANDVLLSDHLRMATWSEASQGRSPLPERFQECQVLSVRRFSSGRQYWEVEGSATGSWRVGMAYQSIERIGRQSWIGHNDKSWCLCKTDHGCWMMHDSEEIKLPLSGSYGRLRIYLDYQAGELRFYELQEQIKCIHSFSTTFTEPLQVAIWVQNSHVRLMSYQYMWW